MDSPAIFRSPQSLSKFKILKNIIDFKELIFQECRRSGIVFNIIALPSSDKSYIKFKCKHSNLLFKPQSEKTDENYAPCQWMFRYHRDQVEGSQEEVYILKEVNSFHNHFKCPYEWKNFAKGNLRSQTCFNRKLYIHKMITSLKMLKVNLRELSQYVASISNLAPSYVGWKIRNPNFDEGYEVLFPNHMSYENWYQKNKEKENYLSSKY